MKTYTIPILTEEYIVNVFIGSKEELIKRGERYCEDKNFSKFLTGRGLCVNGFDFEPIRPPAIFVLKDLPKVIGIATLAHEASHALDYISEFINLKDTNGEFKAHGIAAVLRGVLK